MKIRFFILIVCLFMAISGFAQRRGGSNVNWLSIAGKGGYGMSMLMNQESFSDMKVSPNFLNGSYFFGGRLGWSIDFNSGSSIGVSFEVNYSTFGQEYDVNTGTENFNKKTTISSLDMFPVFRFQGATGFYLELGPKFSTLKSIEETPLPSSIIYPSGLESIYNEKYTSGIFGIGFMPLMLDRITLSLGVRANYGWKSMTNSSTYYSVMDDGRYVPLEPYSDATINLIQLQPVVEFNYFFGFFGDATCGRGRLMLFQ